LKKHLLFIDTETTGIPKRWKLPYSEIENWPSAIQVSWILYEDNGSEVKREDCYINVSDLEISAKSFKIHGITKEFLSKNGKDRKPVLEKLSKDIQQYQPIIIGHFTKFDIDTLSCDFYREGLENPFKQSTFYCTMLKSKDYNFNPSVIYLRLNQLFEFLFNKKMQPSHNAMIDAEITAKCFFEIRSRGEISEIDFKNIHHEIIGTLKFLKSEI